MRRPIRVRRYLTGDIDIRPHENAPKQHKKDFNRLLRKLALAARDCKEVWNVNSGYRSYGEQQAMYYAYKKGLGPLAAAPGTSNHNKGRAADVSGADGRPVGDNQVRRRALKRFGLCLPVAGERWHVEAGSRWMA